MKYWRETGLGHSPAKWVPMIPIALRTPYVGDCPVRSNFPCLFYQPPMAPLSPLFSRPHRPFCGHTGRSVVPPTVQIPSILKCLCTYSSFCLEPLPCCIYHSSSNHRCFRTWFKCSLWEDFADSLPPQVKPLVVPFTAISGMSMKTCLCHHFFNVVFIPGYQLLKTWAALVLFIAIEVSSAWHIVGLHWMICWMNEWEMGNRFTDMTEVLENTWNRKNVNVKGSIFILF